MPLNLRGRNFLTLLDFTKDEIQYLLDLSEKLKAKKMMGIRGNSLEGKNIALIFEKPSTRTRCAFVVAARDEGGMPEYLGKNDIQLGKKESVADTARVLGRMFDGIQFRGFKHETVEILGEYAGVPVWNGLTDKYHPTQVLADLMTIQENFGYLEGINLVYVGDGRNNMANSLMIGSAKMGLNYKIVSPKELWPEKELVEECKKVAKETGSKIEITDDPVEGVKDADVLYTDVWFSMGEEDKFVERVELLKPFQVNMDMIKNTGNDNVIFLHCLPSYHNTETENGKMIYEKYGIAEMEVTDEVFESSYSKVFDEAENRMHTIKAVMVSTLGE
ncbi:ornithine carbamoyltransferase [Halothermothrix orenii]|uniref:Ornithine carbamoyltransferase n=1 Tax=Halothermothrix orenii (strain H 168 / OCM 544 / DSM 9562) TaxID=373903 RepID=B8D2J6_HALOH|nr:ornithine carbamoyltransferase [Halothermothrix orenii]ACL69423.1 ornithine carbamoyltransferase [Halothermothrix orenii H 168]